MIQYDISLVEINFFGVRKTITRKIIGILAVSLPSGVVRSFIVLALIFSNAMCFATEAEEEQRLNEIVGKIVTQVKRDRSATWLMHENVIRLEKKLKKQYNMENIEPIYNGILKKIGNTVNIKCEFPSILGSYMNAFKEAPINWEVLARINQPLVDNWNAPPEEQLVNCDQYAYYAFSAVVFDIMNRKIGNDEHLPLLFTSVIFLGTRKEKGNHIVVLVEGASGKFYLVDSWSDKVAEISGFADSGWKVPAKSLTNVDQALILQKPELITIINQKFADEGYYDVMYVRDDTQWMLYVPLSNHLSQLLQTRNDSIRPLYNSMRPVFGWKPYNDLFGHENVGLPDKSTFTETKEKSSKEEKD